MADKWFTFGNKSRAVEQRFCPFSERYCQMDPPTNQREGSTHILLLRTLIAASQVKNLSYISRSACVSDQLRTMSHTIVNTSKTCLPSLNQPNESKYIQPTLFPMRYLSVNFLVTYRSERRPLYTPAVSPLGLDGNIKATLFLKTGCVDELVLKSWWMVNSRMNAIWLGIGATSVAGPKAVFPLGLRRY